MSLSDEQLCEQVRRGSTVAFSELWQRHNGEALGYAKKLNRAGAEDAVAEVMVSLYESLCAGKGPGSSFRSYLMLSVRNRIYRGSSSPVAEELPEEHLLAAQEAPANVEVAEDATVVHEALQGLPARWREVLVLCEVQGKSLAEVGQEMGLESNAVSALLRRARAGLRRAWVAAHFSGAKLNTECSNVVEAFGEFRWGKPTERQRAWFERHVAQCQNCYERQGTHAWLAQAVGLALLPLAWMGGTAIFRAPRAISSNFSKPVVLSLGAAAASATAVGVVIAAVSATSQVAIAEPNTEDSVQIFVTDEASQAGATGAGSSAAEALAPHRANASETLSEAESGQEADGLPETSVGGSGGSADSATPSPSLPPSPSPTPGPIPVRTERIMGSSRPGASIEFLLSDTTTVTALADSNGDFLLDIPWPADKPAFSYVIQRVY